ncbi:hypothetical protein [Microtetraspora niveoalba]|uniref:hypothetical protein n=1 Tax=Microtetraspora niveoalba TaxID=46175 RepID=UPI0008309674|nr:hypothetical protein [Microtetraspora niveoalba]
MSSIEDRLKDAMAAKAETVRDDGRPRALPAPQPWHPLRSRWGVPALVAAAIVTVVAGTAVGVRGASSPAPAVRPTPSGPGADLPPIEDVWPDAVHEIPVKAPGGRTFTPDVFVNDRVVVGRGLTRNRLDGIWSYDLDKRTFARIAPLKDWSVGNDPLVFGDGAVAWSAFRDGMTEIWTVPVMGGIPRRIASFRGVLGPQNTYEGITLAIADGMAVWSPANGGVYRVPLKGGRPTLIKETKGYRLLTWPWAGRPYSVSDAKERVHRPMEQLIDVRTGERVDAVPPPGRVGWSYCGVRWCINEGEVWRRDGTGLQRLPGNGGTRLYSERFTLISRHRPDGTSAIAVHDISTRRTGVLGIHTIGMNVEPFPTLHLEDGLFWYRRGSKQVLVNLSGIR